MPPDGHHKQDGERAAGKRWMTPHAAHRAPHGVTFLGADLYSHQPFGALARQHGGNFLFVCQPDSHPKLYEQVAFWQATGAMHQLARRRWHGRFTAVMPYRCVNDVLLRGGADALSVHGCESTVVNAKTGEHLSHNSCIPNPDMTSETVADVAPAGRTRWKSDNEHKNVRKPKGSHIAQNLGHGTQSRSALLLSLNLRAFLFHTVLEWSDAK